MHRFIPSISDYLLMVMFSPSDGPRIEFISDAGPALDVMGALTARARELPTGEKLVFDVLDAEIEAGYMRHIERLKADRPEYENFDYRFARSIEIIRLPEPAIVDPVSHAEEMQNALSGEYDKSEEPWRIASFTIFSHDITATLEYADNDVLQIYASIHDLYLLDITLEANRGAEQSTRELGMPEFFPFRYKETKNGRSENVLIDLLAVGVWSDGPSAAGARKRFMRAKKYIDG